MGVANEEAGEDFAVALPVEGGDRCTLLANELFVGARTLLLKRRADLTSEAAIPSDVSARVSSFLTGNDRSSRKPVDILRMAEVGDLWLAVLEVSVRLTVGVSDCAAF